LNERLSSDNGEQIAQRRFRGRASVSQSRRERRKHNKGNKGDNRRQDKQQQDPNIDQRQGQSHQLPNQQRKNVEIIIDKQTIRLHVYHLIDEDERIWLYTKDVALPSIQQENSISKWIQLDLNKAVNSWLSGDQKELMIQIYCEHCTKYGLKIFNNLESSHLELQEDGHSQNMPALNIIGKVMNRLKRKSPRKDKKKDNRKEFMTQPKKTVCHKDKDKKCCRHQWIVDFKDVEGFEFVIQPQQFDAGYCEGSCPYRYNLGNTHAYIQSLLHHSGKNGNVPDVCCAATRVVDMEVLHLDETDPTKLKVSTWKKMRVMKCSCT
jgi:integrin beta 8